jgi:hypothetical protein
MRFPCSLCKSLDHFTYQCPTIIEYRRRQMALIQNPPTTSLPVMQVIPPIPSPDTMSTSPPLNLSHFPPLHGSWIDCLRIFPQIPPILRFISPKKSYPQPQFLTHSIWTFGLCQARHHTIVVIPPLHLHHLKTITR